MWASDLSNEIEAMIETNGDLTDPSNFEARGNSAG